MERLETSNKSVFDFFFKTNKFKHHQICFQCHHKKVKGLANLSHPTDEEIKRIAETYGVKEEEIFKMRDRNGIFVYKVNGEAVSYAGIHVDGSLGLLYTKPECRRKNYASLLEEELFKILEESVFSQILTDNKASVSMHKRNGWKFNRYKIYWLFNEDFE